MAAPAPSVSSETGKPWAPGQAVGRYTLLAKIATGGMAEIWLARQAGPRGFEKVVVIKRIVDTLSSDPDFVDMFLDEARIAAQLNHPNIVQIYDLGEHLGAWYIAMEYLPGENLATIMRASNRAGASLDYALAARLISSACEGLYHAHTKAGVNGQPLHIVHRDVSPQNIIVTYDGQVKVVDFGIARAANRSSQTVGGQIKGKFAYMAPEQALGQPLDARADLFALGVILYEMVTRSRLFAGEDQHQTLSAVVSPEPVLPAHEKNPQVPVGLSQVISRALERSANDRYPDARAFQAGLEAWLRSQGHVPGPAEVSALMAGLFSERIESRVKLIESASRGELTPVSASHALRNDTENSMPGLSGPRQEPKRRWLVVALAVTLVMGALVGGGYLLSVWLFAPPRPVEVPALPVAEPAPRPAVLVVETEPAGAAISLDGQARGKAPVTLEGVEAGEHALSAALEDYQPVSRTVKVTAGERSTVMLSLPKVIAVVVPPVVPPVVPGVSRPQVAKGKLTLSTVPWTHVTLNGKLLGDTPLVDVVLPAGKHMLKLTNEDKNLSRTVEVEIKSGQTTTKKLSL